MHMHEDSAAAFLEVCTGTVLYPEWDSQPRKTSEQGLNHTVLAMSPQSADPRAGTHMRKGTDELLATSVRSMSRTTEGTAVSPEAQSMSNVCSCFFALAAVVTECGIRQVKSNVEQNSSDDLE